MKHSGSLIKIFIFAVAALISFHAAATTIYFDNGKSSWATPYAYVWKSSNTSINNGWPGKPMTQVNGNMWKYEAADGMDMCIFSDNGSPQTGNLNLYANHDYNQEGDRGAHLPTNLYLVGHINGLSWSTSQGCRLTPSGNKFYGDVTVDNSGDGYGYFSLVTKLGSDWNVVNTSPRYGSMSENAPLSSGSSAIIKKQDTNNDPGSAKSWKVPAGCYFVTVDFSDMTVAITSIEISLNKSSLSIAQGKKATILATPTPLEAPGLELSWTSSAPSVASINESGVVTGVSNGTATITAAYGPATATCTVYVKDSQSITWTQDLSNVTKDDLVTLTASASSNLSVTYTITNGASIAEIVNGNKLKANAAGVVTVQASQAGNDTYAPADPVFKTFSIGLGYKPGDINDDDKINSTDLVYMVDYILGRSTIDNISAADMNGDNLINIVDITLLIDAILRQ